MNDVIECEPVEELLRPPIGPLCWRWEPPSEATLRVMLVGPDCDHTSCWEVGCR